MVYNRAVWDRVHRAEEEVFESEGDKVSISLKKKSLLKFGKNVDLGTSSETVWIQGGDETYATGNDIDTISSSDEGDAVVMSITGHTLSGSELTEVTQLATLDGQNKVTLTTPLYRVERAFNTGSTGLAGTVYVYEDDTVVAGVPQTAANIHLKVQAADNQSLKAAASVANNEYYFITSMQAGVNRQQSRSVDFSLQVREFGKIFRTKYTISAHSNGGSVQVIFDPCIVIPKNSDWRVVAESSGTSTQIEASVNGYVGIVVS